MVTLKPGRVGTNKRILAVRELVLADLEQFLDTRQKQPAAQRFRDSHHRIARLFAAGLKPAGVVAQSGYSMTRVSMLHNDPAFQELIASYRGMVDESFKETADAAHELMTSNMLTAQRMIADQLEAADLDPDSTPVPLKTLVAISADAADRVGYGKKQTNVNVNVDFAAKLEQRLSRAKVVELRPNHSPASGSAGHSSAPQPALPPLRRRV